MKTILILNLILFSFIFPSYSKANENKALPNPDGYCGLCNPDQFVGGKCDCTIDKEAWEEAGYSSGRCVRNVFDPGSTIWLCQVELH